MLVVIAENGFGVYDHLKKYLIDKNFMKEPVTYKTIALPREAAEYAISNYNHRQDSYEFEYNGFPEDLMTNWFYYKHDIRKENNA